MPFRSPRLTTIFGASPDDVTYEQLTALIGNEAAGEAEDLDYKLKYDSGDKGCDDIAVDVATFANHLGGVIIVGMAETNAHPSKAIGVELTDQLERRVRACVASRVYPRPQVHIRRVPDPATVNSKPPRGFLLIMVPRSPLAPHAVVDPREPEKLRWPRRHGTGKLWMNESEIAAGYRRRFAMVVEQGKRLTAVETECLRAIENHTKRPDPRVAGLLVVSLVPDEPGELLIDRERYDQFAQEIAQQPVAIGDVSADALYGVGVGRRRLLAETPRWPRLRAELHTDGSGAMAIHLPGDFESGEPVGIYDSPIIVWTASALRLLARHARDRAGASGGAAVSASLRPYIHDDDGPRLGGTAVIVTHSPFYEVHGCEPQPHARGETYFLLDHLADDGQPLAQATERLVSDLFQAFNAIGTPQITRDGELKLSTWGSYLEQARRWAAQTGIPTI